MCHCFREWHVWAGGDIDQCVIVSESGMCGLVVT